MKHESHCASWSAWDIPNSCNCAGEPEPKRWDALRCLSPKPCQIRQDDDVCEACTTHHLMWREPTFSVDLMVVVRAEDERDARQAICDILDGQVLGLDDSPRHEQVVYSDIRGVGRALTPDEYFDGVRERIGGVTQDTKALLTVTAPTSVRLTDQLDAAKALLRRAAAFLKDVDHRPLCTGTDGSGIACECEYTQLCGDLAEAGK